MTDKDLAESLKRLALAVSPRDPLLEEASDRIYALSAHNALLKASLAQAEREAEAPAPSVKPVAWLIDWPGEPGLGYFFGEEPSKSGRSRPLYLRPAPESIAEPFGYFRAQAFGWEDCAATDEGAKALYERPAPDRVAELEAEVARLRSGNAPAVASWYFSRLEPSGTILAIEPGGTQHTIKNGNMNSTYGRALLEAMTKDLSGKEAQS